MGLFDNLSWRGPVEEDEMTDADKMQRAGDQARAMLHGGDPFLSSPDEDGIPTGGCYNMDYPDSYHDEQNEKLNNEPGFAARIAKGVRKLLDS